MISKRIDTIKQLFPSMPAYRAKQVQSALFNLDWKGWGSVSVLSKEMREQLVEAVSWMSLKEKTVSQDHQSSKALLETSDGMQIETVLLANARGQWTVCVSSQVGCAMNCSFCATGKLGLKRNLTSDEIVDQYRYWADKIAGGERISNIVYMGMGEPLANYAEVKESLNIILANTDIGETKITVSTVGVLPRLDQILEDDEWPPVRLAVSLHSVDSVVRKKIMPSSSPEFLKELQLWAKRYETEKGNRQHHITFEYLMLSQVNDSKDDAKALVRYLRDLNRVKVNVIAYNETGTFKTSNPKKIDDFCGVLRSAGVDVMRRQSHGQGIDAACGQLASKSE
jgi:23S rRNA (adenine2503-C2)-methyltransferase